MLARIFTAFSVLATIARAAYAPDEIVSLPGWEGALPSKQYSGYLNVSSTHLHYWLVESESDPTNAPTVLWFNGGPGCSSLDGFVYEHGPFEISDDFQTLSLRPYRWNLLANVLYIEAPVGVGFSYSDDGDYNCNDDRTAAENRLAVEAFFEMFPEYKENKFFITGESYAGVYVPTLAEEIVKAELNGTYTGAKLSGIGVGNGCSGTEVGICGDGPQGTYYEWKYLTSTSFVDMNTKKAIDAECDWEAAEANTPGALSIACVALLNEASTQIGHVDMYNIYGDCVSGDSCGDLSRGAEKGFVSKVPQRSMYSPSEQLAAAAAGKDLSVAARITPHGPDACIDSRTASGYLNRPDVMQAIHVRDPGFCWTVCGSAKGWKYTSTRTNLPANTYPLLVSNIEVTIFNGDWDACVPYTDGQGWTSGMGLPEKDPWHAWTYTSDEGNDNQVAGYATVYDVSSMGSGSFAFVTVRGGRHEVPESAPAQAFEMLTRILSSESF